MPALFHAQLRENRLHKQPSDFSMAGVIRMKTIDIKDKFFANRLGKQIDD